MGRKSHLADLMQITFIQPCKHFGIYKYVTVQKYRQIEILFYFEIETVHTILAITIGLAILNE